MLTTFHAAPRLDKRAEAQVKVCPCRGPVIAWPPEGGQPLGCLLNWSMGGKHKQKIVRVECP